MKPHEKRSAAGPVVQARRICRHGVRAFRSDSEILRTGRVLFSLRTLIEDEIDESKLGGAVQLERKLTKLLHACLSESREKLHVVGTFREHRLSRAEAEVMLLLALSAMGMVDRVADVEDVQRSMGRSVGEGVAVVRALSGSARLAAGLNPELEESLLSR